MEDKIREIIKANLPEQAAGEMKKFISKAEMNKEIIVQRDASIVVKTQTIERLEKEIKQYRIIDQRHAEKLIAWDRREAELIKRESIVRGREIELDLTIMRKERDCAVQISEKVFHLTEVVFKNPVVKKTVIENKETPMTETRTEHTGQYDNNSIPIMGQCSTTINHMSKDQTDTTEEIL